MAGRKWAKSPEITNAARPSIDLEAAGKQLLFGDAEPVVAEKASEESTSAAAAAAAETIIKNNLLDGVPPVVVWELMSTFDAHVAEAWGFTLTDKDLEYIRHFGTEMRKNYSR